MMKMNALGRLVLVEAYGCDRRVLDDLQRIEDILVRAAQRAGADIHQVAFHRFSPQGISGVVVISESHLAVHTWPEVGYAAVDVFTCGDRVDPWQACQYISEQFGATAVTASEIKRGILTVEPQQAREAASTG
ncbi:MAG: adenosylmethionine decarboxylase [Acetobacteraceae bacterium]|nr:adenosylmethionine decarboxylase [Acetobacteraceae bacterium]